MEMKRCSQPLVVFVQTLLPTEAGDLKASNTLQFTAHIRHVFYKASPGTWWIFEVVGGRATESWAKTVVVWQSGLLFMSMATRILQLLAGEVQERRARRCDPDVPLFGENEMLIFVGMSLGRLLRPLE